MSDEKLNRTPNRTNEQPSIRLTSKAAKRLAAIFLSNPRLTLKKIYKILHDSEIPPSFTESALRGVLARWRKRGLLLTDGYSYILNPVWGKTAIINALGGEKDVRFEGTLDSQSRVADDADVIRDPDSPPGQVFLELIPRWWSEVFDLPAAWLERTVIQTKVNQYLSEKMCRICEKKPTRRDRSKRHVHREETFTLEVFPKGKVHIWTKEDARWLDKLGKWLKRGGFNPSDLRLVASAIERELPKARTTLEIPLKVPSAPVEQFNLHIEFEGRVADLRLVRSHFGPPYGELEIRADVRYIVDWLGMVTGASLTVMKDETRLDAIEKKAQEAIDEVKKLKDEREALKKVQEERAKKEPDYIG